MQYFIPAWYQNNDWKENEQVWYRSRTVTEFDDTVKQIQLFFRKHVAPFKILLLGFSPNFRHYLHRQGVYHVPYWSCFDAMQGISMHQISMFSFHDLTWPDDVEFIYSPFAVIVRRDEKKFAQIEFAEDGNMFRVDMYKDDEQVSSNYYDDRGFMSLQVVYQNGLPYREQYFNSEGVWKFARFLNDGHVVINPESNWYYSGIGHNLVKAAYKKKNYASIDQVIAEVLQENLRETTNSDIFIVAAHPLHAGVLAETLSDRKVVLSFFARRIENEKANVNDADKKLLEEASYVVVDERSTEEKIKKFPEAADKPLRIITPYDSRKEFGDSLHLRVQNVLVAVDDIPDEVFDKLVVIFADYIININKKARIVLFTRSSRYDMSRRLLRKTKDALSAAGMDPDIVIDTDDKSENYPSPDEEGKIFTVAQCVDELSVSRTLREQRIIVDLQEVPDQFLQISAMSMGIPQITVRETDYVKNGKNGIVIDDLSELADSMHYYLSSITNVNNAQIASYKLGGSYSTGKLVQSWKEVIESVER
ncbi:MAG: accessory Sec system protein Asp1 [Lachnospiraceae bacterium]|uniref:Accessory Sec system protein Asp1 n=1 Tax=Candidatus Weimeria bifida TaxID=2599074 RepID=A0A6N7IWK8_9FIRM|nr:accessory Sec system protein Asp1 [Candidatus Weimeria bifida]RRF96055.1 MAG: accessory Sec system protein Asp1 [Lachnospiraceae bacterium]